MKNIKYLFFLSILLLASCSHYLNVQPKGKVIPQKAEDYSTIIHYWLDKIEKGSENTIVGNSADVLELDSYADDQDASLAFSSTTGTPLFVGFKVNSNQDKYPDYYSVIKDCNMIIGEMDDTESELAKKLLGTAWTLRSICYYNLLIRYCSAYNPSTASDSLGLTLIEGFNMEAKIGRSNLEKTVAFIKEGFKKALTYNVTDNDYILTVDVANAYLTRLAFWTKDWDEVILYATPLLDKYPILNSTEYSDAMKQRFKKATDVILRSYTVEDDLGSMDFLSSKTDVQNRPVSKNLVNLFAQEQGDIRVAEAYDKKRIPTKMILSRLRSEELCLDVAEAYAHKEDAKKALFYLNDLRSKRIDKNYIAYTEDHLPEVYKEAITTDATGQPLTKLMSAILCERRKELFMEGDRWFELKRNGCPEFWVASDGRKYVITKSLYTFPIYKNDVDLYPGLIIQNPGYTE